jgi:hypothetical protein
MVVEYALCGTCWTKYLNGRQHTSQRIERVAAGVRAFFKPEILTFGYEATIIRAYSQTMGDYERPVAYTRA